MGMGGGLGAGQAIELEDAKDARKLLFGDSKMSFNDAWKKQGLCFNDLKGIRYGIVQHEGGPCGALAAVQAEVLRCLIFPDGKHTSASVQKYEHWANCTEKARNDALVEAVTRLVMNA